MAVRVMVEHSNLLIGIWDGVTRGTIGGTRHTIEAALEQGIAVAWIDARNPDHWHVLRATEELAGVALRTITTKPVEALQVVVSDALQPSGDSGQTAHGTEKRRNKSNIWFQAFRRVELLFGDPGQSPFELLRQPYEHPLDIATGSGAPMLAAADALPGVDLAIPKRIATDVLKRFAWADGVSTWLSDAYRGGTVNRPLAPRGGRELA